MISTGKARRFFDRRPMVHAPRPAAIRYRYALGRDHLCLRSLRGRTHIDQAVAAARQAFDAGPWPQLTHAERAGYLTRIADAIDVASTPFTTLWTYEVGALVGHGPAMVGGASALFRQYAALADEFEFVERHTPGAGGAAGFLIHEPVGVVAAIIPWNAPILMLASKLARPSWPAARWW